MKIYIITDTHFNHKMLVEKGHRSINYCSLLWNGIFQLPKNSLLIHLGDICIGKDQKIHNKLSLKNNITKILVRGNHDSKSDNYYLNNGWDFVCEQFTNTYFGKKIVFSHKPVSINDDIDFNIHGHFHVIKEKDKEAYSTLLSVKHKFISMEDLNYKLVSLEHFLYKN